MGEDEVLNSKEAADLLKISKNTLFKMIRNNQIPAQRVGKEWRFSRQALLKWLESGKPYVSSEEK